LRALDFPVGFLELLAGPGTWQKEAVRATTELAFTIHRLGGSYDDFLHRKLVTNDALVDERNPRDVHVSELAEVGHVILVSCLMEDHINPFEGAADRCAIRDTCAQEFRPRRKPFGKAVRMNPWMQVIQDDDFPVLPKQSID
jgi:hypothetical protein